MKIADLDGVQLDYWVAKAEGYYRVWIKRDTCFISWGPKIPFEEPPVFMPRVNPADAWPIILRERISMVASSIGQHWVAGKEEPIVDGPTPLIAAMRCYLISKFGEEVPE